jgi:MFS family permease
MIITGLTFHQVAMLGSRGVPRTWALGMISVQALVATLVSLPAGWLTDRIAGRRLLSLAMLLLAAASATVLTMPVPQLAVAYAILLGLHGSILRTTGNVIWLNYYGRKNQGGIRGIMMSVMILAAALGPLPMALSIDRFHSYDIALLTFIAIPLAAASLVGTAVPPRGVAELPER